MALDFDQILEEISDLGRYQKLALLLLCVPVCFLNTFGFSLIFLIYTPDFYCVPTNTNSTFETFHSSANNSAYFRACTYQRPIGYSDFQSASNISHHTFKCSNFVYDKSYFTSTVATQWDLVCDKAIYPKIMMSVHSIVTLFACLFNSYLQDLWGRKITFLLILTINLIGTISSIFAPNFLVFSILRSFVAYSTTSMWNVGYTWALEYVGPTKRSMVTTFLCVMYGVASVFMGGVAWLFNSWIKLNLAGSIPFLALYSYAFILDESPRWLLSQGRNKEALKIVQKMARWENIKLKDETVQKLLTGNDREELQEDGRNEKNKENETRKPSVLDLLRTRNMRRKTCLLTYCWVANLLTYLAIGYNMENLRANLFVTYCLQAAVEIPSSFLIVILLERWGRIPPLCASMVVTGFLLFITVPADLLDRSPWSVVALALAAKFGISFSFGALVQVAGESYPTHIRGLGTGFSSFVGTLGSTVMPYVVHSATVYKMLPMILMGTTAVTAGFGVLMLPETKGRYMPETIAEAESTERVGLAAMKENWRNIVKCGRKEYTAVNVGKSEEMQGQVKCD